MRFIVDGVEVEAAVELDDTVDELKTKLGVGPVYLYAQKRVAVTSRDLFREPVMSKKSVAAILANLNVAAPVKDYDFETFLELGLDGVHDAWIPLGQDVPDGFVVVPGENGESETWGKPENKTLLEYLPLLNDAVYGVTEAPPAYIRRFKSTPRENVLREVALVSGSEISARAVNRSRSNAPVPLAELFQTLHADNATPALRYQSMRRFLPGAVPPSREGLAVSFGQGLWAAFQTDGTYEVGCEAQGDVARCEAVMRRVNPFLKKLKINQPFTLAEVDLTLDVKFSFQLVPGSIPALLQPIFSVPLAFRRHSFKVEVRETEFRVSGIHHVGFLPFVEGYLRMLADAWRGAPVDFASDDEIEIPETPVAGFHEPEMDVEDQYFSATCSLLRQSLQPADREEIHGILAAGHRKVGRILEVVDRVLSPMLEVVEMPASFGFKCGKRARMLVPKTNSTGRPNDFVLRLAEELVHDDAARAFILACPVVLDGKVYEVVPPEVLVRDFVVSRVIF